MTGRCQFHVWGKGRWDFRGHQCTFRAKHTIGGVELCGIHKQAVERHADVVGSSVETAAHYLRTNNPAGG